MIKLNNLNKYYFKNKSNEIHVINNLSLTLDEKGFTTILGPSGSGKSTLLHIIGGLDKASGSVTYDDATFTKLCGNQMDLYRNKYIGYIFQNYHLLPDLTVYQNLKIQLELIGIKDEAEIEKRINITLKAVKMDKYKRRNVTALSGGQQQRVAIARALVKGAKVIIADEPTGNLDSKNSIEVMNILKRLSKICLIVLVTHDKTLAAHYSDRIVDIKDGQIVNDRVNENDDSYLLADRGTIYLDQYEKEVLTKNSQKVELYTNSNKDISLKIIVEKNAIYIQGAENMPIKIIGEHTNREVKTSKKDNEVKKIEEEQEIVFESEKEATFKQKLLNILEVIKNACLSFFFAKKKTWLVYLSFFFIGALLCCCIGFYNYSTTINENIVANYPGDTLRVDPKAAEGTPYYEYSFEYNDIEEIIAEDNGVIGIVEKIPHAYFYYPYVGNRKLVYETPNECYGATPYLYGIDMDLKGNEIALSRKLANNLVNYYSSFGINNHDELLSATFNASFEGIYTGGIVIKEIFDCDNNTILFSDDVYYLLYAYSSSSGNRVIYRGLEEGETLANYQPLGVEINPTKDSVAISNNLVGFIKDGLLSPYQIVATFDSNEFEFIYLDYAAYEKFLVGSVVASSLNVLPYETSDIELVEGQLPLENNTVIIPDVLKNEYPLGSSFSDKSYEVVGYFKSDYPTNTSYMYTNVQTAYLKKLNNIYKKDKTNKSYFDFYYDDLAKAQQFFKEKGYDSIIVRDKVLQDATASKMNEAEIAILVLVSISIVMIVFIFFMSRSRIMHNIYNIGVYRALGAKKSRIYTKYLIDSLVMATFTAVFGFLLLFVIMNILDNYITNLTVQPIFALTVTIGLYFFMILASLLPVYALLRKTPIEILVKYDI